MGRLGAVGLMRDHAGYGTAVRMSIAERELVLAEIVDKSKIRAVHRLVRQHQLELQQALDVLHVLKEMERLGVSA